MHDSEMHCREIMGTFGSFSKLAQPKNSSLVIICSLFGLLPINTSLSFSHILCQIIDQVWVENFLANKLAKPILAYIWWG
jgi:hypothetical protein